MVSNTPEAVLRGCEQALGLRRFQNRIGEGFWQEWRDSNPQPAVLENDFVWKMAADGAPFWQF